MYKYKNNIYADAGHILKGEGVVGLVIPDTGKELHEEEMPEFTIEDGYFMMSLFRWNIRHIQTYGDAKKWAVGLRYTNDDQIAIMLNKDDDEESALAFQKMQEWREWASVVAKKIMEVIESNETDR